MSAGGAAIWWLRASTSTTGQAGDGSGASCASGVETAPSQAGWDWADWRRLAELEVAVSVPVAASSVTASSGAIGQALGGVPCRVGWGSRVVAATIASAMVGCGRASAILPTPLLGGVR